jgi:hypothetical protein
MTRHMSGCLRSLLTVQRHKVAILDDGEVLATLQHADIRQWIFRMMRSARRPASTTPHRFPGRRRALLRVPYDAPWGVTAITTRFRFMGVQLSYGLRGNSRCRSRMIVIPGLAPVPTYAHCFPVAFDYRVQSDHGQPSPLSVLQEGHGGHEAAPASATASSSASVARSACIIQSIPASAARVEPAPRE